MSDEILNKLDQIVKDIKPSTKIDPDANLRKDSGLDSLDMFSFFFEVEKMFGIKISEEDISKYELINVSKIIGYIKQKISN